MERIELVKKLLESCIVSAMTEINFWERSSGQMPEKYDLYVREAHFLVAVGPEGHPTMSEMALRLGVTQGAVSQLAARLEGKGYISRDKDTRDRRQTTVSLTEKGKTLCAEHIAYDEEQFQKVSEQMGEFSDEDLKNFIAYEEKMWALFTKFQQKNW